MGHMFLTTTGHGGFFSPRLRIGSGELGRGLFATEDLEVSEVLVSLPSELIILDGRSPCLAIKRLRNELQKGTCSFFWPYLKTLHGLEINVPAVWSVEDVALLDGLPTPKGGSLAQSSYVMPANIAPTCPTQHVAGCTAQSWIVDP